MVKEPHKYRDLSKDEQDELFSNYLMDSISFSKISAFSRNEKSFEMQYIYNIKSKRSASEVAGSAYHEALKFYFSEIQNGIEKDIVELEAVAYAYIDGISANSWKLQKTTTTISEAINKATKTVSQLIKFFLTDISVYRDEIKEILYVEVRGNEFITVNGVDLPLPLHFVSDLVIKTNDEKIVIIDHKSKVTFTDEKELKFSIGKQAISYVLGLEAMTSLVVDEVWFIENKSSENKDKSPQLACFKVEMSYDNRRLYEVMLYEPLRAMLVAISDPDYLYILNPDDNFISKEEIYEFWAMTLMADVSDFDIPENKKELIGKRLRKIKDSTISAINPKVIKNFRECAASFIQYDLTNKDMDNKQKIEHTLRSLNLVTNVAFEIEGFSCNTYLLEMSAGTNLSSIFKYRLDIANALNVASVRIMKNLFVYKGKSYIAVESSKIRTKDLVFDKNLLIENKIPIGIDNLGQLIVWNTENHSTPHVLVSGSSGSGKSVCLASIVEYAKLLSFDNIIILDSKHEFKNQKGTNISVYNEIEEIETMMERLVEEMNTFAKMGVKKKTLIIFDEFADSASAAKKGAELDVYKNVEIGEYADGRKKYKREKVMTKKSLEENLRILLQKGRSIGYRIVAATQRGSAKILNGDLKVNLTVKICYKVPKSVDSVVVLDEEGAETLAGYGDGLISSPEYPNIVRFQSFYYKN